MTRRGRSWRKTRAAAVAFALGLSAAACASGNLATPVPLPSTPVVSSGAIPQGEVVQASVSERASVPEGPLSLERLIALAMENRPELAAAQARVEAARGKWLQAGLYPNPRVGWEADELGHKDGGAGEQGPFLEQQIVTGGKLRLAQSAAAEGIVAADWQAVTSYHEVARRVRSAYYDVLAARREVRENEEIARIAEEAVEVAKKLLAATGSRIDQLRAQIEFDQARFRLASARQREEAAWKMLSAAVGLPSLPSRPLEGTLDSPPPTYDAQRLLTAILSRSSEIREAEAEVAQARQELQRAWVEPVPDLHLRVRPFYAFPDDDQRLLVEAGISLPFFNKNEGNIVAAQAEVARAAARVRQVELRLTERLTGAFQRYEIARGQAETYGKDVLPNARESLRLVRLGWEKNDPKLDYNSVLLAQRTLVEARLAHVQALGELWRASSEIMELLQEGPPRPPGRPE